MGKERGGYPFKMDLISKDLNLQSVRFDKARMPAVASISQTSTTRPFISPAAAAY